MFSSETATFYYIHFEINVISCPHPFNPAFILLDETLEIIRTEICTIMHGQTTGYFGCLPG